MKSKKPMALSTQIFIALVLAIIAGVAFTRNPAFAVAYIKPYLYIFQKPSIPGLPYLSQFKNTCAKSFRLSV